MTTKKLGAGNGGHTTLPETHLVDTQFPPAVAWTVFEQVARADLGSGLRRGSSREKNAGERWGQENAEVTQRFQTPVRGHIIQLAVPWTTVGLVAQAELRERVTVRGSNPVSYWRSSVFG